ncbi:unnamed protein product [Owenia fusiformis]|uniref:Uncharacterized protein n=1 Tax=Owenia fusiformis TaxID=6347 RepID=A0A8S4NWQ5_OWEFU|nr:unnamed protein product [Owenia fusiformis]
MTSVEEQVRQIIPNPPQKKPPMKLPFKAPDGMNPRELILGGVCLLLIILVILIGILYGTKPAVTAGGPQACTTPECLSASSYLQASINDTVNPCEDFHAYACSGWAARREIRPDRDDRTVLGDLFNSNEKKLTELLEYPIQRTTTDSWERKVKTFFLTCMDEYQSMQSAGNPLIGIINECGGWWVNDPNVPSSANFDINTSMKKVHVDYWSIAIFQYFPQPDPKDNTKRLIEIDLGGLGMDWRIYLQSNTGAFRTAYRKFITDVANLLVRDNPNSPSDASNRVSQFVDDVFNFETQLANITGRTLPDTDPDARRIKLSDLNRLADEIDWTGFFQYMYDQAGITPQTEVILLERDYLMKVSKHIKSLGADKNRILNNYLVWRLTQAYTSKLSWDYIHAAREFTVALTGRVEFLGKRKSCFRDVQERMGLALSALFVRANFGAANKQEVDLLFNMVRQKLFDRLATLPWMDDTTRLRARDKLKAVIDKVGYPDFMMDDNVMDLIYQTFQVSSSGYFQNYLNSNKFEKADENRILVQGRNKERWRDSTYAVKAQFYYPWNELLVPAGILQFPMFDAKMPGYMTFGGIGTVMGRMLIHAVDDLGGYYNKMGNQEDWWTNSTSVNYIRERKCVINFYSNVTAGPYRIPGYLAKVRLNGRAYFREGIAENGGIRQAYYAYKDWDNTYGPDPSPAGTTFTKDQAFFLSYAQTRCFNRRDIASFNRAYNGQVPEDIRVNGALGHLPEFQQAFNCPANSQMNVKPRCYIF